ncbi:MAG: cyanophycin synthetase, partial [Isosphaeraceae bacterium]|nr:cyanophycin synthetase [Isosphaeraceae bacterium]
ATGAIPEAIAQDKDLTRLLLHAVGVPVPVGRPVEDAEDAWEAAREIGAPVVVKPRFGNQGRGVATNLSTREQVMTAFADAKEEGDSVVVERYHPGADYRVLVVNGRVVAASRREPAQVIGDGRSSIDQLVEEVNKDPRRGEDHATALSKIVLNSIALAVLAEQGFTPDSVPAAGQRVLIRRNANLSTGGTAEDVTDLVHPEVAARSIDAARVIGLDIAGIDVIAQDISRPLEDQAGVVVEVNAGPGLRMHIEPSSGKPRPVGEAIVASLFPEGENGRIPIAAVTGVNGKTTTARLLAHIVGQTGKVVGMTCSDGIYVGDRRIDTGDCSGPQSARSVLVNPQVEAAVFETARGGILREGLGFDRCDVAVVTNIGEGDHLGLSDIQTVEALAQVKRTIVDVVPPGGSAVLNADDPLVAAMAEYSKGAVIYWAWSEANPTLRDHREQGGRVVFVRDGVIILAAGATEIPVLGLSRVPLTRLGRVAFQVENVLAATAAAWAFQLPLELIREGLSSFDSTPHQVPGRFNVLESNGATVIVDYAHNVSAVSALLEAVKPFPSQRRRIVFSAAGDRRDDDVLRQTEMIGDVFDSVILHESSDRRGRAEGDIVALMRRGLALGSRVSETLEAANEPSAIRLALTDLREGDLVVIQPDAIDAVLRQVQLFLAQNSPQPALEPLAIGAEVSYALPVAD